MPKFIFITGGVVSSLGKGITSASIGRLMENIGFSVTLQKLDPYINVDPGTMSPFQHGEVYVTDDGAETDLDLGHYERFTSKSMARENNFTTGQVYDTVITRERRGDYLGRTVQVVPHVIDEIKDRIKRLAKNKEDIIITEIGGTVGDIEGLPFLEAIRQFRLDFGKENVLYVHLTYIVYIAAAQELKTKPTQHSVGRLREIGIQPDILVCRTSRSLSKDAKSKISLFCNVAENAVVQAMDVSSVYEVPRMLHAEQLDQRVIEYLSLKPKHEYRDAWEGLYQAISKPSKKVTIGVVGKYVQLQDAYKSIYEAVAHGGICNDAKVTIKRIDSERLMDGQVDEVFQNVHGILVPGGFGTRGIEGKIQAVKYAREHGLPFFGICLGMQCAVIEFARSVCGLTGADSIEFDANTPHPVIDLMEEQKKISMMGGTMRLGAYPCTLLKGSKAAALYGAQEIRERHRHRYEFNSKYAEIFQQSGMAVSGRCPEGELVEILELQDHPWFVACQYHPEFKSKPHDPHPLFRGFVEAAIKKNEK